MGAWPKSLIHEIAERRVVFFVGAGISIAAYDEHKLSFPNWSQLLSTLALDLPKKSDRDYVGKLIRKSLYLEAAQVIHDTVPAAEFSTVLREQLIPGIPVHASVYEHIVQMDPKIIATTNYDTLIEKNYEHYSKGGFNLCRYNQGHALDDIRSPMRVILKTHGCISEPQNVVLSRSSYFNARRNYPEFFRLMSAIMTTNTVVFFGYSFSDPDIQLILENVHIDTKCRHPHYALIPKFSHPSIRKVNSETYNIQFVEFQNGRFDQVPLLIKELSDEVNMFRQTRGLV